MSDVCEDCGFYMKAHPPGQGCPKPRHGSRRFSSVPPAREARETTLIMGLPDHQQPSQKARRSTSPEVPTEFSEDVVVMVMPLAKAAHLLELAGMEDEAARVRSKAYRKGVV